MKILIDAAKKLLSDAKLVHATIIDLHDRLLNNEELACILINLVARLQQQGAYVGLQGNPYL